MQTAQTPQRAARKMTLLRYGFPSYAAYVRDRLSTLTSVDGSTPCVPISVMTNSTHAARVAIRIEAQRMGKAVHVISRGPHTVVVFLQQEKA